MSEDSLPPDGDMPSPSGDEPSRRDYEVGYGKPPVHSRFRPGRSGNPGGRPRGARGLGADLIAELAERVTISQDGKAKRLSKRRVILKALTAKAAKGDVRAADKLLSMIIQMQGFEDQRDTRTRLSDSDRQILDLLLGEEPPSGVREPGVGPPEGTSAGLPDAEKEQDDGDDQEGVGA